jgi:hypothetical protein
VRPLGALHLPTPLGPSPSPPPDSATAYCPVSQRRRALTPECTQPVGSLRLCSLFIRYDGGVGSARTCVVYSSIQPVFGILSRSRRSRCTRRRRWEYASSGVTPGWMMWQPGTLTPLCISVKPPATTHEVSIKQLERWIASTPKSPRETAQKSRVRELLQPMG